MSRLHTASIYVVAAFLFFVALSLIVPAGRGAAMTRLVSGWWIVPMVILGAACWVALLSWLVSR